MLPTEDKSIIYTFKNGNGNSDSIHIGEFNICDLKDKIRINQHLYFTSDKERLIYPNKGWTLVDGELIKDCIGGMIVIATTNTKLKLSCDCSGMQDKVKCNWMCKTHRDYKLPQIPQSFVKKYVKQGGIDEVELEYNVRQKDISELVCPEHGIVDEEPYEITLKLTPNNEVIIHLIEEKMYNKNEVVILLNKLNEQLNIVKKKIEYDNEITLEDWIKENLK